MSYESEHRRFRKVLETADKYDIATNPAKEAIFESLTSGFQIWCTPDDHPKNAGWDNAPMLMGAFSKPCCYVGTVLWGWGDGKEKQMITHLELETDAFDLDHRPKSTIEPLKNRPKDVDWAIEKIEWLFRRSGVKCPPIIVERAKEIGHQHDDIE